MRKSAGILLFRKKDNEPEFFLVHPGGPYWKNKETGTWSIPKGEISDQEDPLAAAKREFHEETGQQPEGRFIELTPIRQKAGKWVYAWALEGDIDPDHIISNTCKIEWPYKSGRWKSFPEVDKGAWFPLREAIDMINPGQTPLLHELSALLSHKKANGI